MDGMRGGGERGNRKRERKERKGNKEFVGIGEEWENNWEERRKKEMKDKWEQEGEYKRV